MIRTRCRTTLADREAVSAWAEAWAVLDEALLGGIAAPTPDGLVRATVRAVQEVAAALAHHPACGLGEGCRSGGCPVLALLDTLAGLVRVPPYVLSEPEPAR